MTESQTIGIEQLFWEGKKKCFKINEKYAKTNDWIG